MKKRFVSEIRERDRVEEPFLVRSKIMAMAKNGRPYMTLKLMDRSGEVEGRVWDRVDEFSARFERDDFLLVSAKASVYMGKMQLVIQDLRRVSEQEIELSDFLPVAAKPVAEMVGDLQMRVAGLEDPHLKALMQAFLDDPQFMKGYSRAPAAKAMHHVYLGGLLEHALAVAALAGDVSRRYPALNRDLLIVGALLHDIGKVAELKFDRSFEYTDAGKLLGHIVIGVEMVEEKLRTLPDFPRETAIHIKHLLLSHHGQYDFGSPKRPKTLEAVVLNFLDDMDSKINGVQTHIDKEPDSESAWTQYHRLYDRYFYKGSASGARRQQAAADPAEAGRADSRKRAAGGDPVPAAAAGRPGRFSNTLEEQLKMKNLQFAAAAGKDTSNEPGNDPA